MGIPDGRAEYENPGAASFRTKTWNGLPPEMDSVESEISPLLP